MKIISFCHLNTYVRESLKLFQILLLLGILLAPESSMSQGPVPVIDRARGKEMLQNIKEALKELYFDQTFHGMNVDARFKEAEKQISASKSTWQINAIIAQVLLELDDSHTRFAPTDLVVGVSFGFQMQMIGDACYITRVKPGSNAEAKGLKAGDMVYAIEGYEPTRESLWKIAYSYFTLMPPPTLRVTTREPDGRLRELVLEPTVSKRKRIKVKVSERSQNPPLFHNLSEEAIICKLPEFDLSDKEVDEMMKRIKPYKVLILDLRGNPGGRVVMEQRLLGYLFDKEVKIGDFVRRKESEPRMSKNIGKDKIFTGKIIVLIDSQSASAAEVFARVMQLERRATVIGDRTAGAVRTSIFAQFAFKTAADWQAVPSSFYGASITIADLIMADGKSIEKTGVIPDVVLLPKGADLAAKRDPVLAHVATLAGAQLEAGKAGAIFPPPKWDDEEDEKDKKDKDKK